MCIETDKNQYRTVIERAKWSCISYHTEAFWKKPALPRQTLCCYYRKSSPKTSKKLATPSERRFATPSIVLTINSMKNKTSHYISDSYRTHDTTRIPWHLTQFVNLKKIGQVTLVGEKPVYLDLWLLRISKDGEVFVYFGVNKGSRRVGWGEATSHKQLTWIRGSFYLRRVAYTYAVV